MASPDAPRDVVAGGAAPVAVQAGAVKISRGRARQGIKPLPATSVGGVAVGKHALEAECERLQSITRRIGLRMHKWLCDTKASQQLPDKDFVEVFRYYQASVLSQLREQRERYKQAGGEGMSTEALEAQFRMEVLLALRTFTEQDWSVADRVRRERFGDGAWCVVVKSEEAKP